MKPKTQHEIIVAFLRDRGGFVPTHNLMMVRTAYGYIGGAGHVRVRELAEATALNGSGVVERKNGKEIGLDPRFKYFRIRQQELQQKELTAEPIG